MLKQNGKKWANSGCETKADISIQLTLETDVAIWCNAGQDEKWKSLLPICDIQQKLFG